MQNFKAFTTLFLIMFTFSCFAQQATFIQPLGTNPSILTPTQLTKYQKVTSRPYVVGTNIISIGNITNSQQNGTLDFQIPDKDCLIKSIARRVRYTDDNNYSWSGFISGSEEECECEEGAVALFMKNGSFMANISVDEEQYIITDLGEGKQILYKTDYSNTEITCGHGIEEGEVEDGGQIIPNVAPRTGGGCNVTILAVYTDNAETKADEIGLDLIPGIEMQIERTNTILVNSGLSFQLELVGIEKIPDFESGIINSLQNLIMPTKS